MKKRIVLVLAIGLLVESMSFCLGTEIAYASATSAREIHQFGLSVDVLGRPFPSAAGVNASYNFASFLQGTVGFGQVPTLAYSDGSTLGISSIGAGGRLFVPGWNFSPTLGLHWAQVMLNATGAGSSNNSYGFRTSGSHLYASLGFDWQTSYGLNLGLGYNVSLMEGVGSLPYFSLGWFF
jgi:hypothetical protein